MIVFLRKLLDSQYIFDTVITVFLIQCQITLSSFAKRFSRYVASVAGKGGSGSIQGQKNKVDG